MQEIISYLEDDGSFNDGVKLYHRYGNNHHVKLLLAKGETRHSKDFLIKELKKLTGIKPIQIETIDPVTDPFPTSQTDPYIEQLNKKWKPSYKQMQTLRAQLPLMRTNAERGKAALYILQLEKKCNELWTARDHYLSTGIKQADDKTEILYLSPIDAAKKIQTNKRMRFHYSAQLKADKNQLNASRRIREIDDEQLLLQKFLENASTQF